MKFIKNSTLSVAWFVVIALCTSPVVLAGGTMNPTMMMRKSIRLQGIYVGSHDMFKRMNEAVSTNQLKPVIDQTFPFADAASAYYAMQRAEHLGKLVVAF